jgi:nucleoside-diphosphate-sugar epimerase
LLTHLLAEPAAPARVVVVGSGGFVGNAIAARVERQNVPVLRVTRREVDLLASSAADRLASLLRPDDVVVAAAALAPCRDAEMLRDNIVLALAIAKAAQAVPVAHVVNISSDAIYSDSPEPLTEASPTAPDNLHGIMHVAREAMFRSEIKAPMTMLRPTLIYGAGDPHNGYGPNRFRRAAAKGEPIVLFGKGEERRDHVPIDDVAELAAQTIYRRSTGALNIATGYVASFREIAEKVVELAGRPVAIRETQRTGPMPHNGYRPFDTSACRAAFPDFAFTPLAEGLARAEELERTS